MFMKDRIHSIRAGREAPSHGSADVPRRRRPATALQRCVTAAQKYMPSPSRPPRPPDADIIEAQRRRALRGDPNVPGVIPPTLSGRGRGGPGYDERRASITKTPARSTTVWTCDVCQQARFDSYEDAVECEKKCIAKRNRARADDRANRRSRDEKSQSRSSHHSHSSRRGSGSTQDRSRDSTLYIENEGSSRRGSGGVNTLRIKSAEPWDDEYQDTFTIHAYHGEGGELPERVGRDPSVCTPGQENRPDPESEVFLIQDGGSSARKNLEDPPLKLKIDPNGEYNGEYNGDVLLIQDRGSSAGNYLEDPPLKPKRDPTFYVDGGCDISAAPSRRSSASSIDPYGGGRGADGRDPSTHAPGASTHGSNASVRSRHRDRVGREPSHYSQGGASQRTGAGRSSAARGQDAGREHPYREGGVSFRTVEESEASWGTKEASVAGGAERHGGSSYYDLEDSCFSRTSAQSRRSTRSRASQGRTSRRSSM